MGITNLISHLAGKLAYLRLPDPLAEMSVKAFAKCYSIDLSEASSDLSSYKSVGELFIRDLKLGARPLGNGVVSPVDGRLRDYGKIKSGCLTQVKGRDYSLEELLANKTYAEKFQNGIFFNFYLSPQDYHHVHTPVAGELIDVIRIAGSLWPVNDWAIKHRRDLFTRNERLVVILKTQVGLVAVVMVGALNVGDIVLSRKESYGKGEKLGTFKLGSSVIVLLEESAVKPKELILQQKIRCGESIGE